MLFSDSLIQLLQPMATMADFETRDVEMLLFILYAQYICDTKYIEQLKTMGGLAITESLC